MTTKQFLKKIEAIEWPIIKITWKDGTTDKGMLWQQDCFHWVLRVVTKTLTNEYVIIKPSHIKKIEELRGEEK